MAKKTDLRVLQLIREVKQRNQEIARLDKPNWLTNCSFSYVEGSNQTINLHVEQDVRRLVDIAGFLLVRGDAYNRAATELGLASFPPFTWNGFPVAEWLEDIKTRIGKLQISVKRKSLEDAERRLNAIMSPDLRAELELEAITKDLNAERIS